MFKKRTTAAKGTSELNQHLDSPMSMTTIGRRHLHKQDIYGRAAILKPHVPDVAASSTVVREKKWHKLSQADIAKLIEASESEEASMYENQKSDEIESSENDFDTNNQQMNCKEYSVQES
ncbi:hypothetical protein TNCV_3381741 [Trichonephila clavipes]|nr:hypothetical protein TNCV_3381741 [Trichonephila clavipes]